MKVAAGIMTACRGCGRSDTEFEVVSEHRTAQGVIRYARCSCGSLQVLSRSRLDDTEKVLVGVQPLPAASADASVA